MKKNSKGKARSKDKKLNAREPYSTHFDFDERFADGVARYEIWLDRVLDATIKDAQAMIEIYCRSVGLKMDVVDFEIFIDGEDDKYWLTVKIGRAYDAMGLVSSLIKRGYAKYYLKVRDNSARKTIFTMVAPCAGGKDWHLGIEGTSEEVDEWNKRNRNHKFLHLDNRYLHEGDEY
jgi:hypothetical protein